MYNIFLWLVPCQPCSVTNPWKKPDLFDRVLDGIVVALGEEEHGLGCPHRRVLKSFTFRVLPLVSVMYNLLSSPLTLRSNKLEGLYQIIFLGLVQHELVRLLAHPMSGSVLSSLFKVGYCLAVECLCRAHQVGAYLKVLHLGRLLMLDPNLKMLHIG